MQTSIPKGPQRKTLPWTAALVICGSVFLMVFQLGGPALGNDEAAYARRTTMTWGELMEWTARDNIPPLWPALMKVWSMVGGIEAVSLRLPSVFFAAALLPGFFLFVTRRFGPAAGWAALVLLSFSPFHLFLSRVCKYFSLMALLTFGAVALTWNLMEETRETPLRKLKGRIAVWGLCLLLAIWIHYLGAVLWLAVGGWLLWRAAVGKEARGWRLLGVQGLFALGYLPWLPVLLGRLQEMGDGVAPTGVESPLRAFIAQSGYTLYTFAVGQTLEPSRLVIAGLAVAAFSAMLVIVAVRAFRGGDTAGTRGASNSLLRGYLLYNVLFMAVTGFIVLRVFVPGHPVLSYAERLGFLLPVVLILVGEAWVALAERWRYILAVAYAPAVLMSLVHLSANRENVQWEYVIPWEDIREEVRGLSGVESVAVVSDSWHLGSRGWYYLRREREEFVELRAVTAEGLLEETADRLAEEHGAVWLVRSVRDTSPGRHVDEFTRLMEERYTDVESWGYVQDSERLRRLKELFRRGTEAETHEYKVELVLFR